MGNRFVRLAKDNRLEMMDCGSQTENGPEEHPEGQRNVELQQGNLRERGTQMDDREEHPEGHRNLKIQQDNTRESGTQIDDLEEQPEERRNAEINERAEAHLFDSGMQITDGPEENPERMQQTHLQMYAAQLTAEQKRDIKDMMRLKGAVQALLLLTSFVNIARPVYVRVPGIGADERDQFYVIYIAETMLSLPYPVSSEKRGKEELAVRCLREVGLR